MNDKVKVLVYDLEITPTLGWTYGIWQVNVLRVEKNPIIMSYSYMWYEDGGENVIHHERISQKDLNNWSDKKLAIKLRDLFIKADVVIAHNANRFDNKVANGAFLRNNLTPPSPYKTVDTLMVARSVAKFNSNSLDSLGQLFGLGEKSEVKHSSLWYKCLGGCKESWKLMETYNNQDVEILVALYEKLRPYIKNHPNMGDLTQLNGVCPKCLSSDLKKEGTHTRRGGRVQSYSCNNCGGWCNEATIVKPNGRLVNA